MRIIGTLIERLRALRRKDQLDRELDEEVRFHLEMQAAECVRRGMTIEEARYAAQREFGGVEQRKEEWRDARFLPALESWCQDLGYAVRALGRARGFALFAVLSLALGIGTNTAVFTMLRSLVLRPLPYPEPERLVQMQETAMWMGSSTWGSVSAPNLKDWRDQNTVFESMGAYAVGGVNLAKGEETVRVAGAHVESEVFQAMKVAPLLGRVIRSEENVEGRDRVVVLSYGLWQRSFGADPNVVGTRVGINGGESVVIGVMPAGFQFPPRSRMELWTPLTFPAWARNERGSHYLNVLARLKEGTGWTAAQLEMNEIARRLEKIHRENATRGVRILSLHGETVRGTLRILTVLWFAVAVVLLLACANVAHLVLARAMARRRELALRAALGAGRWRLVRLFLIEGLLLAAAGGAAGFFAAGWSLDGITAVAGEQLPQGIPVETDWTVLCFCAGAALFSALLAALPPAWNATRVDLQSALKEAGSAGGPSVPRSRNVLMVWEVGLALVLVMGALVLLRSLRVLNRDDLGFDHEQVLTMKVAVPSHSGQEARVTEFHRRVVDRVQAMPGVIHAAEINLLPVQEFYSNANFSIRGRAADRAGFGPAAEIRVVTPGYFQALGIPLVRGRYFLESDLEGRQRVAIINRRTAELYWPGQDPVGQWVAIGTEPKPDAWMRIAGVVDNVRHAGPYRPPLTALYVPLSRRGPHWAWPGMSLVVRSVVEPEMLAREVRQAVRSVDPNAAVYLVRTMEGVVNDAAAGARLLARLLAIFSGLAVALALVGVYGVMSYLVSQRTHEIGVRMTLGAGRGEVLLMVLGRGARTALVGVAVGTLWTMPLWFLARHYLLGENFGYLWSYGQAAAGVLAVALAASFVPAWRASRLDPQSTLRSE